MRYIAVAIIALEVVALWLMPTFLVGPATVALGSGAMILGAQRRAPAFALGLCGGAALGMVPTLGPILPASAVLLFLAVAAVTRLGGARLVPRKAAIPLRTQG